MMRRCTAADLWGLVALIPLLFLAGFLIGLTQPEPHQPTPPAPPCDITRDDPATYTAEDAAQWIAETDPDYLRGSDQTPFRLRVIAAIERGAFEPCEAVWIVADYDYLATWPGHELNAATFRGIATE